MEQYVENSTLNTVYHAIQESINNGLLSEDTGVLTGFSGEKIKDFDVNYTAGHNKI